MPRGGKTERGYKIGEKGTELFDRSVIILYLCNTNNLPFMDKNGGETVCDLCGTDRENLGQSIFRFP